MAHQDKGAFSFGTKERVQDPKLVTISHTTFHFGNVFSVEIKKKSLLPLLRFINGFDEKVVYRFLSAATISNDVFLSFRFRSFRRTTNCYCSVQWDKYERKPKWKRSKIWINIKTVWRRDITYGSQIQINFPFQLLPFRVLCCFFFCCASNISFFIYGSAESTMNNGALIHDVKSQKLLPNNNVHFYCCQSLFRCYCVVVVLCYHFHSISYSEWCWNCIDNFSRFHHAVWKRKEERER